MFLPLPFYILNNYLKFIYLITLALILLMFLIYLLNTL
jgi:hypothetical protein